MSSRPTCFGCPKMNIICVHPEKETKFHDIGPGLVMVLPCCTAREGYPVVPHHYTSATRQMIFWRVPKECPLEEGVIKSMQKAHPKQWVTKDLLNDDVEVITMKELQERTNG